nr:PREDICTED: neuropeptides B/W receptor type 1 [Bos mutus]
MVLEQLGIYIEKMKLGYHLVPLKQLKLDQRLTAKSLDFQLLEELEDEAAESKVSLGEEKCVLAEATNSILITMDTFLLSVKRFEPYSACGWALGAAVRSPGLAVWVAPAHGFQAGGGTRQGSGGRLAAHTGRRRAARPRRRCLSRRLAKTQTRSPHRPGEPAAVGCAVPRGARNLVRPKLAAAGLSGLTRTSGGGVGAQELLFSAELRVVHKPQWCPPSIPPGSPGVRGAVARRGRQEPASRRRPVTSSERGSGPRDRRPPRANGGEDRVSVLARMHNASAVLFVLLRAPRRKTVTNLFILNLAVADELFTLVLPVNIADFLLRRWPFGELLCKLVVAVDQYNTFSSLYFLTVMSADRYLVVLATAESRRVAGRTYGAARAVSLAVWGVATLVVLPFAVFARLDEEQGRRQCVLVFPQPEALWWRASRLYTLVLGFAIPVSTICVLYTSLLCRLRAIRLDSHAKALDRAKKRVTVLVVAILAVCLLCWTPYHLSTVVALTTDLPQTPLVIAVSYFITSLSYANSCLNPFLYAFLDDSFRRSLRQLLACRTTS